jgi:hypothetical protein
MRFREWLRLDEIRWKGLHRQYQQQNPEVPPFVLNQMYRSIIHPTVKRALAPWLEKPEPEQATQAGNRQVRTYRTRPVGTQAQDPTTHVRPPAEPTHADGDNTLASPSTPRPTTNAKAAPPQSPSDMMRNTVRQGDFLSGNQFPKRPMQISISPAMLDADSLSRMVSVRFGLLPNDRRVYKDTERFDKHRGLAIQRGEGNNEPIILVRKWNGKYELLDGYHRLSAYFLQTMPPEYRDAVRNGDFSNVDFSTWPSSTVNAYIGYSPDLHPMMPLGDRPVPQKQPNDLQATWLSGGNNQVA